MIVPDSFRQQYEVTRKIWEPIKFEVDGIFQNISSEFLYSTFNSRIKPIESVLLKSQKGGYQNPFSEMEDFFACELVLPLTSQIGAASERIAEEFEVLESSQRVRPPYDFSYSGKHYLLRLQDKPMRADKSVLNKVFELQVKTYLQSAWQYAGHNIIYKPNRISYWTERIAGQLRGLLGLADSVLAQIEETANLLHSQSAEEEKGYKPIQKRIIKLMTDSFEENRLPPDKRRMAVIIQNYIDIGGITVDQLEKIILQAKDQSNPVFDYLTINPIDQVFILIYQQYKDRIEEMFERGTHRVMITPEMEDFYPVLKNLHENGRSFLV
jgi:ppGpp synthetase/RelA/SpoT-type nucleotidyltranferase